MDLFGSMTILTSFLCIWVDSLLFLAVPTIELNLEFEVVILGRIFNGMWF